MLRKVLRLRRRPDEDNMSYNTRTAAIIRRWFQDGSRCFSYVRVIKAVFKSACRDGWSGLDFGASPLRDARDYRSAEWWQTVCALEPPSKRRRQGIQHRHPGKSSTSWEHPFVQVWGIHWKNKRNACGNLMQWMRLYPEFSQSICDKWSLCMLPVSSLVQSEHGPSL